MITGEKTFKAYCNWEHTFKELSDENAGQLIKEIFNYVNEGETKSSNPIVNAVFALIKPTLTKPSIPKKRKTKPQKTFSTEVESCYQKCLGSFPENLHPKTPTQIESWKNTIHLLNKKDNIPLPYIVTLVAKVRADSFWQKNFLSITKLRKNNPDGIKYVVVFNEKFKQHNEQQQTNKQIFSTIINTEKARNFRIS